jgi:V/A-type H+-transporting ATPase subunit I
MTIARVKKLRLIGPSAEKEVVLCELQELGCLMPVPLRLAGDPQATAPQRHVQEALAFLLSCPYRRPQITDEASFDPEQLRVRALELQTKLKDLEDERDALVQRRRDLEPWGEFTFPPLEEMGGQRLWFYAVPQRLMPQLKTKGLHWQQVNQDHANCYLVVVSADEPRDMPVGRVRSGSRSSTELRRRLEEVEQLIEDAQAERSSLTRWCMLFVRRLDLLEDRAAREQVARQMLETEPLFGLEAWVLADKLAAVEACVKKHGLAREIREPTAEENPPTLLQNSRVMAPGEGLVQFYMTPGYWTWDPSPVVLVSFAVFFALIMSDAGYAAVLGVLLAFLWKRLSGSEAGRQFRTLLGLLTATSLVYGVMVGSYFGVAPAKGSLLSRLVLLDVNDAKTMMGLSVVIGVTHLVLANLLNAQRFGRRPEALAPLGWAMLILGGFLVAVAGALESAAVRSVGLVLVVIGSLLILVFSGVGKKPLARAVSGLLAFTKVTSAFGDVLSYLRLFALGLAGASLAVAFNDIAGKMRASLPALGLLLALLVLLIGHGLNLLLGLSSAVIHGLRLNLMEFFNWALPDEGTPFRTFAKKEQQSWTIS